MLVTQRLDFLASPGLDTDWLAMMARRKPAAKPTRSGCTVAKVKS